MEDILASIRRIISDEVASAAREPSSAGAPAVTQTALSEVDAPPPAPAEVERPAPELPPFVSRYSQTRTEARPLDAAGSRERPAASSAYAPVGRVPAADPFVPRRSSALPASPVAARPLAARAEPVFTPPAPRPSLVRAGAGQAAAQAVMPMPEVETPAPELTVPETPAPDTMAGDPDARLAAALLDIDLVEQAVQAELATMSVDPALDAVTADPDVTQAMMADGAQANSLPILAADLLDEAEPLPLDRPFGRPPVEEAEFAPEIPVAMPEPATASLPVTPPEVENAHMQATAKPFQAARVSTSDAGDERRAEARHEPRFLPSARAGTPGAAVPASEVPAAAPPSTPTVPAEAAAASQRLISGSTNHAVSAAFGSLARTVASNSRTVDDLVTEALRPMLKEWLDENLPALVERLVRAEIERVSRQGQ